MQRGRIIQVVCLLLAVGLLVAGGFLQREIRRQSRQSEEYAEQQLAALESSPEKSLLMSMPGGLRVMAVNYLWIRSQQAHQDGRHYDAYQLAELICALQPNQPGVWAYQAWNMAWNISVTTKTNEERWQWVYNGVKLLRDQGIPMNPRNLALYKELSWIYFSKIGGTMDEAHWSYKARWAGMMQDLLGAPPFDDELKLTLEEETRFVIDTFRPIAEAPLDKTLRRQGREMIQPDQRTILLRDAAVKAYADELAKQGIGVDETFLLAFNSWSRDNTVETYRVAIPQPKTDDEKAYFRLMNDAAFAEPRKKVLAFVRAQLLWNQYRMDPTFMLELMEQYKAPLDWRHAMPHALYWAAEGMRVCKPKKLRGMIALNNARNVLNALKTLFSTGLIDLRYDPRTPQYPVYRESADLRYIAPTDKQHQEFAERVLETDRQEGRDRDFSENILAAGHINFLIEAINLLVADGRIPRAQKYFDYIRDIYKRKGPQWDFETVEEFSLANIREDGALRYPIVLQMLQSSLKRAYVVRGLAGDEQEFRRRWNYAVNLFKNHEEGAVKRMKFPAPFPQMAADVLARLLVRPTTFGLNLSVDARSEIYLKMDDQPNIQIMTYHVLENSFKRMAAAEGIDVNKAFPKPAGLDEFRQKLQDTMQGKQPNQKIED